MHLKAVHTLLHQIEMPAAPGPKNKAPEWPSPSQMTLSGWGKLWQGACHDCQGSGICKLHDCRHCSDLREENRSIRAKIRELFMWLAARHYTSTQNTTASCLSNVHPSPGALSPRLCICVAKPRWWAGVYSGMKWSLLCYPYHHQRNTQSRNFVMSTEDKIISKTPTLKKVLSKIS